MGAGTRAQGDTWAFDTETRTWTQMNPANKPARRYGSIMVYDSYTGKCLLFGGHLTADDGRDLGYENEIWAYDFAADDWEMLQMTTKPPARYWHDLAYDPEENRIILFSGSQGGGNDVGDTWVYRCREGAWTKVTPKISPPARSQPSMTYDARGKRTMMFGGADFSTSSTFIYYNDVWVLGADNERVELVAGETSTPAQTSPGVPGFQPLEVVAGVVVVVAVITVAKRRKQLTSGPCSGS
jgi:hypothetical protein